MNSGAIPDSAISASSAYDEKSVGPKNARFHSLILQYCSFIYFFDTVATSEMAVCFIVCVREIHVNLYTPASQSPPFIPSRRFIPDRNSFSGLGFCPWVSPSASRIYYAVHV
jgi:hypothetical protein